MIVYLDTSVVLRVLFNEPNPISFWGKWTKAYASVLLRVETFRTVDRLRLGGHLTDTDVAQLSREIEIVNDTLHVLPLTDAILLRASESFPTSVGTLDSLHLATAAAIKGSEHLDMLLTHDRQLGIAARSLGFEVTGIE